MNLAGPVAGISMIAITAVGHILVIKGEKYFGVRLWPVFLVCGIACMIGSIIIPNSYLSIILGISSAMFLWGILELFQQRERVRIRKKKK